MNNDLQKRLAKVDLNLLPILLVLMQTRSTQETAAKIGRTQSAVSHSLARLREMLGDELLVRHGPKLVPSPRLLELEKPIIRLLSDAVGLVERGLAFDAANSEREIVIGCLDLAMPMAEYICAELAKDGPHLKFRITGPRHANSRLVTAEVDLVLALYRNSVEPGLEMTQVGLLEWSFYASQSLNLEVDPSVETWCNFPHVQVYTGGAGRSPIDDAVMVSGVERNVALRVESYLQALYVVSQGKMLFSTFPTLAEPVARKLGLTCCNLPIDLPPAPLSVLTRSTAHDPFVSWLHSRSAKAASSYLESNISGESPSK